MSNRWQDEKVSFEKPEIKLRLKKKSKQESVYQKEQTVLIISEKYAEKINSQLNDALTKQQEKEK